MLCLRVTVAKIKLVKYFTNKNFPIHGTFTMQRWNGPKCSSMLAICVHIESV